MRPRAGSTRADLKAVPARWWGVAVILVLSVVCAVLEMGVGRPHLWPAGAVTDCIAAARRADQRGVSRGQRLTGWRQAYWAGVSGRVEWRVRGRSEPLALERPAARESDADGLSRPLGMLGQIVVFTGAAILLFFVLRRSLRYALAKKTLTAATVLPAAAQALTECPRCGRCEDSGVETCPSDGAPMRSVPSVPRIVDGKYRIEQLLGRGGMGAVYRARDVQRDRPVAVKVVRAELLADPEARRRFRRDADIVARLQHPGIVAVYDVGTFPDGGAYLVMELVRGEDLRRVLQREGRLEIARAVPILSSVCNAIEAAHRQGVLHGDLKPENILLPGGGVEAKVLDFGVTRAPLDEEGKGMRPEAPTTLTVDGPIVGTPAYMAPEQLRGASPDARTDVFSLGVIAYEMLSGKLPFGRGTPAEIALAQARGVPPLSPGTVPDSIERAIRAALEPDADRRPASPQAFAHLIAAAAGM